MPEPGTIGTCPVCRSWYCVGSPCHHCAERAAEKAADRADRRATDDRAAREFQPPEPESYLPLDPAEYEDMLLAVCLAYEAVEFGASLNRAAAGAGADLESGGRVDVTALREFAYGVIRQNVKIVISRDCENGFGPGSGKMLDWEKAFHYYCERQPVPRKAKWGDGKRLYLLVERLARLLGRVTVPADVFAALRRAKQASSFGSPWRSLIPWAFGLCDTCGKECDGPGLCKNCYCCCQDCGRLRKADKDAMRDLIVRKRRLAAAAPEAIQVQEQLDTLIEADEALLCRSCMLDRKARAFVHPECPNCCGELWKFTSTTWLTCVVCCRTYDGPDDDIGKDPFFIR